MSSGALPSRGLVFSWYVISIDTGHIVQSPQSGPRWSPAFKMEPVVSVFSLWLFASLSGFPARALHTLGSANSEIQQDTWTLYTYTGCKSLLTVQGFSQRGTCWMKEWINEWTNKPRPASGSSTYYFNFIAPTPFLDWFLLSCLLFQLDISASVLIPFPPTWNALPKPPALDSSFIC